jgi:hypothetical protein
MYVLRIVLTISRDDFYPNTLDMGKVKRIYDKKFIEM